jgi:spore coat polysaccharide biosynthesis protein SpsF (cytidylyltransferase family)
MGSGRLPGKVMLKVDDSLTILEYVVSQVNKSKLVEKIVIATTSLKEDDKIVDLAKSIGIDYFRGDSDDVLDRYYQCAKEFSFSEIVRITSDNPLIDPTLIDDAISPFSSGSYDYATNNLPRTFPQGTEVEIISFNALEIAWEEAIKPSEREHVTPYFYNNPQKFKIFYINNPTNLSNYRWTVDNKTDLELVRILASKIKKRPILMEDILKVLKEEPNLLTINKDYVLNEGYLKSLKKDKEFLELKSDEEKN